MSNYLKSNKLYLKSDNYQVILNNIKLSKIIKMFGSFIQFVSQKNPISNEMFTSVLEFYSK